MKNKNNKLSLLILFLAGIAFMSLSSKAKESVKDYGELKAALESEGVKRIELGADVTITAPITIRGIKVIDGKGHTLERSKKKGKVYGGTLFLMVGSQCEWKNVIISGSGKDKQLAGKIFGRLLEVRKGITVVNTGCVWKDNINKHLAVDGGGALWIRKGARCHMIGGEVSNNENVSCGAGIRVDDGGQLVVQGGNIVNNITKGVASVAGFEGLGAGIYNEGKVTIKSGVLKGNRVEAYENDTANYGGAGGAIYNRGNCTIMGGAIENNSASLRGSAIYTERHASLELCGGFLLSNQDAEKRPLWVGGSCILGKNVVMREIYISHTADVKTRKGWNCKQRVVIEPSAYKKDLCLVRGEKGDFVLKKKRGFFLVRKKEGYYIEREEIQEKRERSQKSTRTRSDHKNMPNIISEKKRLIFYEGESVSKDVLCYGVLAKDSKGNILPVKVKGRSYKKGRLDTNHVGVGRVTYCAEDAKNQRVERKIPYQVVRNKKPLVKTAQRYFFLDEVEQLGQEDWNKILWEGIYVQDDCENVAELKLDASVEYKKLDQINTGRYVVKGYVRDQYGHRYYMSKGEKRRYGEGKKKSFSIAVTIVKRNTVSDGRVPYIRFSETLSNTETVEEWHFSSRDISEIQEFMRCCNNLFSQEANREFMRRYQKLRKGEG